MIEKSNVENVLGPKDSGPLIRAIRGHIDLPENLISLEIRIAVDECVTCKAEFYASKQKGEAL